MIADVRRQGWAIVDQEPEDGLRSAAVSIRNATGAGVAAINLSTHATRRTPAAKRCCRRCARQLRVSRATWRGRAMTVKVDRLTAIDVHVHARPNGREHRVS